MKAGESNGGTWVRGRQIANSLFEIELKCNPDAGNFLADRIST
jgi:hypothetical protein